MQIPLNALPSFASLLACLSPPANPTLWACIAFMHQRYLAGVLAPYSAEQFVRSNPPLRPASVVGACPTPSFDIRCVPTLSPNASNPHAHQNNSG